jgi:HK97 family phage portal protein
MNIFQKTIKKVFNKTFDEAVREFLSGEDTGQIFAEHINSDTAMKYSAVFSCCRVLSETYASMPIRLYRKKENGDRESRNDLSVYDILHNAPNDEMSPYNYKEACMMSLNLGGNSVSEKLYNRFGELVGLYPYQHNNVEIKRDKTTNRLVYEIRDGTRKKELSRKQVLHIPGISLDGVMGLSPISYAASAIRLGMSYEQFGIGFYKNGANASGAFTVPEVLTEEAFQRLKKDIKKNYTGLRNSGTPLILEGGTQFQPFSISPVDAQLIENKRFQVEDICRIYRVPQHLVQMLERSTNNNIEHQSLEFVMYTMLPWFKRSEENMNMQLLTPRERKAGYYLEFKIDALLRGDVKSRAEAYAVGRQWGWLSVNDIRRLENMNPIANGDVYLQPMNMVEAGTVTVKDGIKAMTEEIYNMISKKGE